MNQFGVRVFFDDSEKPVLVSYGQWSTNYTGTNQRNRERKIDIASRTALNLADSYISLFQAGQLTYQSQQEIGEITEMALLKDSDGVIRDDSFTKFVDILSERVAVKAKADLAGRGTFHTWRHRHESGNLIVGVVRVWTLENLRSAQAIRDWKPQSRHQSQGQQSEAEVKGEAGLKKSQDDMNLNDF